MKAALHVNLRLPSLVSPATGVRNLKALEGAEGIQRSHVYNRRWRGSVTERPTKARRTRGHGEAGHLLLDRGGEET